MCLAIPGQIFSIEGQATSLKGVVVFGEIKKEINLAFVPEARIGDYVIVHAGVAITILDEEAALRTLEFYEEDI
ncbi:HypC/HybG/HupF family hydrogenase formation chaperone [Halobacteriovorax sp. GFR7]|uniref:HypC/HybG/HupF family hydrogenase formation chaperone n=1 Tax=Halobacteriovorax sp. GFR7 TaxID=3436040 RepID=UPI003D960036